MRPARIVTLALFASILVVVFCSAKSLESGQMQVSSRAASPGRGNATDADIRGLLNSQVDAWNRGDVESFMQGYWHSEETSFSGTNGVTRGWEGLLARYKRNYPDRKAMGKLTFGKIEVTSLCADAAMILGEWHLEREEPVGGVFTLVARRFPEGWRIIHDHTDTVAAENQ